MVARKKRNITRRRKRGGGQPTPPTFHVVIGTAGRPSLKGMIDSLKSELQAGDGLTILFDGKKAKAKSGYTDDWLAGVPFAVKTIEQVPGLKYYGHPLLNKYIPTISPKTTYMMFADDDDSYISGSFNKLRLLCTDPEILYISKMNYANNPGQIIPKSETTQIETDNIGKPNGIIPFKDADKSEFGYKKNGNNKYYKGDFDYYNNLKDKVKGIVFLDTIIYTVGSDQGNAANGNTE
jgi:hypothetical protein